MTRRTFVPAWQLGYAAEMFLDEARPRAADVAARLERHYREGRAVQAMRGRVSISAEHEMIDAVRASLKTEGVALQQCEERIAAVGRLLDEISAVRGDRDMSLPLAGDMRTWLMPYLDDAAEEGVDRICASCAFELNGEEIEREAVSEHLPRYDGGEIDLGSLFGLSGATGS